MPYNAMAGGSVGPGGSGKTQTHRSVMGEPFITGAERISTIGADKMVLEVRQTKTNMLDLQRAETTSLMERAVHMAAASKPVTTHTSIDKLVATDAGQAQVGSAAACPVLANHQSQVKSLEDVLNDDGMDTRLQRVGSSGSEEAKPAGHGSVGQSKAS